MTQMLRQCVSLKQKDWVSKLPAIEFAMNSARSSTTGFSPFYLNYGRNPSLMIWKSEEIYPGVKQFAENVKDAIMSAHDAIIASRIQNTVQANRKRAVATYKEGDLVYLSTKNISLPKGRARKLAPKYLGPFPITRIVKEGATYQIGLSDELTKRGINRTFHASLLRPHVPNDDRQFPGRMPIQIPGFGESPGEWIVDRIVTHHGKGRRSEFQILWKAGDKSWASYQEVAHLNALKQYCELMGVEDATELQSNYVSSDLESEDEINIIANACTIDRKDIRKNEQTKGSYIPQHPNHLRDMLYSSLSPNEIRDCFNYERRLNAARNGVGPPPVNPPPKWEEFQAEQAVLTAGRHPVDHGAYPRYPTYQPPAPDSVSMPAETLQAIIRAIGNASRPAPLPPPRTLTSTKYVPRRPAPPPNSNRGRGSFGGRGGYANRRGKRSDVATRDPRRHQEPVNTLIPINSPAASTSNIANSLSGTPGAPPEAEDLSFLNEFANDQMESSHDVDVAMNGDIRPEDFVV